jgi:mono/diheme cytochrome c family protein
MSSRCKAIARALAASAILLLGAVLTHRAAAAPALKVCLDQSNPAVAIDARIVRAALRTQGYDVAEVPFVGHGRQADDGLPVGRFARLAASECQLIMGFPVDAGSPHLPPDVKSTAAYASTGFALVETGAGGHHALADLPDGSEVGIAVLDTWAGMQFSTHPNIVMHVYPDDAQMLVDLEHHRIAAGMTWQPFLQTYERKPGVPPRFHSHVLAGEHMVWNLVALFAPSSQDAADLFDKGIEVLRAGGKLEGVIRPYSAASTNASKTSASSGALTDRRARAVVARRCTGAARPAKSSRSNAKPAKPPAIYTEAQATQGAIVYFQNCAMCHGPLLDGQQGGYSGPALRGRDFADPSYDFHVSDIFNFVAKLMPAATPGSLSHEQDVQIMAFILKQNGYPAGTTELTYEEAATSKVAIRYYGN